MKNVRLALILSFTLASADTVAADALAYLPGDYTVEKVSIEVEYFYKAKQFPKPLSLKALLEAQPISRGASDPLVVLKKLTEAMMQVDKESYLALWDVQSRAELQSRLFGNKAAVARLEELWSTFAEKEAYLVQVIDTDDNYIVTYALANSAEDVVPGKARSVGETFQSTVVLKEVGDNWYLTNEMRDDPVYLHWESGGKGVKLLGRNIETNQP